MDYIFCESNFTFFHFFSIGITYILLGCLQFFLVIGLYKIDIKKIYFTLLKVYFLVFYYRLIISRTLFKGFSCFTGIVHGNMNKMWRRPALQIRSGPNGAILYLIKFCSLTLNYVNMSCHMYLYIEETL